MTYSNTIKTWHILKEMIVNHLYIQSNIKLLLNEDIKINILRIKFLRLIVYSDDYVLSTVSRLTLIRFKNIFSEKSILAIFFAFLYRDDEIIEVCTNTQKFNLSDK
jgi:hypothetical protein